MKLLRSAVPALLFVLAAVGCADNVKQLSNPTSIDSYCANGVPRKTALFSILTSVPDMPANKPAHAARDIQKIAKAGGGIVAHFDDLNLYSPKVAKSISSPDEYVHIRTVMVSPEIGTVAPRIIEVELRTPQGFQWRAFDAYDLQSVCIVGTRKS